MLEERLKTAADNLGLVFNYGKGHWQNLKDFPKDHEQPFQDRKKYLLLLWQDREKIFNEYGSTIAYNWSGEFLLVVSSKIDDKDYNEKYSIHIKNLYEESDKIDNDFNSCEDWLVKKWSETEVENVYDNNLDGLKIQFTFKQDI